MGQGREGFRVWGFRLGCLQVLRVFLLKRVLHGLKCRGLNS